MTVLDGMETEEVTAATSAEEATPRRLPTEEQIAAVVEAAYILEAVRR